MYSYRIEQAIRAASILHEGQYRKGSLPYPFITHLLSVAFILQEYTDREEIIIAALLHDTLEDTDYTSEELRGDFGDTVADIVLTLTEPKVIENQKISWYDRKVTYTNQLKRGSKDAVMIAAADKMHNFRSMIEEYYSNYDDFIRDFGKNLDDRIEVYQLLSNVVNNRLSGPLLAEFNHVFQEYKQFIYEIKKHYEPK